VLPESLEPEPLVTDIGEVFPTVVEQVPSTVRTWFDTFDWRLYRRSLFLNGNETAWNLLQKDSWEIHASHKNTGINGPLFAWDFPAGRIRSILEPVLEMRSLLPLVTNESSAIGLRILNSDDKTVALVRLEVHKIPDQKTVLRTVQLQNVRGYEKEFRKLARFFNNYGIREKTDVFYPFIRGVELGGRHPLDYSSKFAIILKPDLSASSAMIAIYRQLLEAMQRNEVGILQDFDSEFLHDFRVAIRRTRSGLGQVKKVLPQNIINQAKKDFSWLGSITGPTRDLDVYLLFEKNYRASLPAGLQTGLDIFFADIRERRAGERGQLVRQMQSGKYRRILDRWHDYLYAETDHEEAEFAGLPVVDLAQDIISSRYSRIIKDGCAVTPSSPDKHLHRLRIQCKKLRYILEFFSSLFPQKDMKKVIKLLKRLQTNLGDHNDLSVQQDMLRKYQTSLKSGSKKNQDLAAALGGLLTNLYHQQQRVRREFAARFAEFSADENARLFKKLFARKT
jgi:CHAD domain-containing protein